MNAAEEQPTPNGTGPEIFPLVIQDLEARRRKGIETYGEPLKAHNGRNALLDLYQEILDASVYAKQALIEQEAGDSFERAFNAVAVQAHATAKAKGWWDTPREDGTLIALVHAELSELLEYLRHGNPPSDHIPQYTGAEEEIADVIIRLMDLAEWHGWNVGAAIVAKMAFNEGRERRHGGKEF